MKNNYQSNISKKETKRKKPLKALLSLGIVAVVGFLSTLLYIKLFVFPAVPKDLTATPTPLFVVDHYVSGEIVGLIERHSFPKKGSMEITPYLKCGESNQLGETFYICGEDVTQEGAIVASFSNHTRIRQPFNLICQAYEHEIELWARIDLISPGGRLQTVNQKIGDVLTYESIVDVYNTKLVPWKKMRNILFVVSIVLILFALIYSIHILGGEWGKLSLTALIVGICGLLLLILPLSRISHIKKEKVYILHTLENTKQIIEIRKSIPLSAPPIDTQSPSIDVDTTRANQIEPSSEMGTSNDTTIATNATKSNIVKETIKGWFKRKERNN